MTCITITGADDQVDPKDLVELSERYPFVEWGILWSLTRQGSPRYPSRIWIADLLHLVRSQGLCLPLSLHLCGRVARWALAGMSDPLFTLVPPFQRVQLNGYDVDRPGVGDNLHRLWLTLGCEFVLQVREARELLAAAEDAVLCRGSLLYDPSGGRGLEQTEWPALPDCKVGVAGGIRPETALQTYCEVQPLGASWIDLESGVRTADRFDLAKVRATLETFDTGTEP